MATNLEDPGLFARHKHTESVVPEYHRRVNRFVRELFWYIVVGVVALITLRRVVAHLFRRRRRPQSTRRPVFQNQALLRYYAYTNAFVRQITYLRCTWSRPYLRHLSPPSLSEFLFLCGYWTILLLMLWTNVIFKSKSPLYGIEWEVVGFRAAWVSTTQLPLVYCTGCRINPISLLTGISHERLNWFHRWAARTLFMTLIVHWSFFYREWDLSHFVQQEIALMPMVIWGFVAWGMIGFLVITGYGLLRDLWYESWLLVHIGSAYLALALTYKHTHCTTYFVLASVGFIAFDITGRIFLWASHNAHLFSQDRTIGYSAKAHLIDGGYIRLHISKVLFGWKAGQHIYLTIPSIRKLQSHPFTIANLADSDANSRHISVIIKLQKGFTLDLFRWALKHPSGSLTSLINGPYGNPPVLEGYDTIILIASGNRASFTLPLLQELMWADGGTTRVHFHLICRELAEMDWYQSQLWKSLESKNLHRHRLKVQAHITGGQNGVLETPVTNPLLAQEDLAPGSEAKWVEFFDSDQQQPFLDAEDTRVSICRSPSLPETPIDDLELSNIDERYTNATRTEPPRTVTNLGDNISEPEEEAEKLLESPSDLSNFNTTNATQLLTICHGRPSADTLIRPAVIDANGEVLVVCAVSPSMRGQVSSCASRLNREIVLPSINRELSEGGPRGLRLWWEGNGE